MKTIKLTNKFAATAFAALALVFATSCSSEEEDDTKGDGTTGEPAGEENILKGDLSESKTLKADVAYEVTGAFKVKSGATLTIPAGTVITSKAGTNNVIAVEMGAKINVEGTAEKPVIMKGQGSSGDWGGLVICGKAVSSEGTGLKTEIGGLTYGGSAADDNSGSINYLIIKDSGSSLDTNSEFNGLSLYTVGSGTTIKNVAIIGGADDGVEFFGGSVSVSNFYLENNEDDSVDWTEGWNGKIKDTYVKLTKKFSTVIESDGQANNPTVENLTAVSTVDGVAIEVKKLSNATVTGFHITGFATAGQLAVKDGSTTPGASLSQFQVNGADLTANVADYNAAGAETVDVADFSWVK